MNKSILFCFALVLQLLNTQQQFIPVPKKPLGFSFGNPGGALKIEAYYDLTCPFCAVSFTKLIGAIEKGNYFSNEDFELVIHMFPLPYHKESFLLSMGAYAISELLGKISSLEYITLLFSNTKEFTSESLYELTTKQVNLI